MTSNGVSDELAGTQPTPCVKIRSSFAAATDRPLVMRGHRADVPIVHPENNPDGLLVV